MIALGDNLGLQRKHPAVEAVDRSLLVDTLRYMPGVARLDFHCSTNLSMVTAAFLDVEPQAPRAHEMLLVRGPLVVQSDKAVLLVVARHNYCTSAGFVARHRAPSRSCAAEAGRMEES